MTPGEPQHYLLRLTPRRSLLNNTLLSIITVGVPVLGVLFIFGLQNGSWPLAVGGALLTAGLCLILYRRYRLTFIGVTSSTIEERGYWGARTSFRRADVATVVLATIYSRGSPEPLPQLVVRDSAGTRILRMRGNFWSVEAMRSVIATMDVTPILPAEVMSSDEFFTRFPGAAYWFERRPLLAWLAIGGMLVVGIVIVVVILHIIGLQNLAGN